MPEKPARRIASARRFAFGLLAFGLVAVGIGFLFWITKHSGPTSGCAISIADRDPFDEPGENPRRISGPNYDCIQLERVSSPEDLERGLSGRESLPQNQGMLFTFEASSKWCFWMKDTRFPLDIIWLNEAKKVVHIETNVQPDSYPKQYCPEEPARYVVEVNAGIASKAQLSTDSQLQF